MRLLNRLKIVLLLIAIFSQFLFSAEKIELSREFNFFSSNNLKGYLTPFFTSIEESINSNIFTTADYMDCWSAGLDLSVSGMFIPNSQTTYNSERPDEFGNISINRTAEIRNGETLVDYTESNIQPTIFGGHSTGIYSSPQFHRYPDSIYKSVGYVEGNNISFMSGLPTLQLRIGLPSRTEVRLRFLSVDVDNAPLIYWGVTAAQRIDQYFNLFQPEERTALALHVAFSSLTRNEGVRATIWSAGAHISKGWDFGLFIYGGLQIEGMSGTFEAVRQKPDSVADIKYYANSPWPEIRNMKDIKFDIESFNKLRILGGISYKVDLFELHFDAAYASQPILTAGISFLFGRWGESKDLERELQMKRQKKLNK